MTTRLLTLREVSAMTALSRSAVYALMAESRFPKPIRIGFGRSAGSSRRCSTSSPAVHAPAQIGPSGSPMFRGPHDRQHEQPAVSKGSERPTVEAGSWRLWHHEPAGPRCTHWGWRGGGSAPRPRRPWPCRAGRRRAPPRAPPGGAPDGQSPNGAGPPARLAAEIADWRAKAAAVGVPLPDLVRRAMARTQTWAAAAAHVEGERTRQVARIGHNLNQLPRWANRHASAVEAVEVVANLVAFERELRKLPRIGRDGGDAL